MDVARLVRDLLERGEGRIYRRVCAAVDRAVIAEVLRHVKGSQERPASFWAFPGRPCGLNCAIWAWPSRKRFVQNLIGAINSWPRL